MTTFSGGGLAKCLRCRGFHNIFWGGMATFWGWVTQRLGAGDSIFCRRWGGKTFFGGGMAKHYYGAEK